MNTATTTPASPEDQRDALMESEKNAAREQPENVKEKETEEKEVEITPDENGGGSIKGIDPE